jgi:hypothetical protein
MKTNAMAQFTLLAVASGIAAGLTYFAGGLAFYHWNNVFEDGKATLPVLTLLSTRYGFVVPLIGCLCSIICVVVSIKKHGDLCLLWRLFTLIVIVELVSLALISWFNFYPALRITYKLM